MNTFFYAAKRNECVEPCQKGLCVCRCLELLDALSHIRNLVILPGGTNLTTSSSMMLRSGDLLILYAADDDDLNTLVDNRKIFDPFRVVLVVGQQNLMNDYKYHLLKPRYLTSLHGNKNEFNAVLEKMSTKMSPLDSSEGAERMTEI